MQNKANLLFIILGGFFIANALLAEFIGVKIFSLESTMGLSPMNMSLFGETGLGFNLTAGVLLWPVVFIMTDIINEYYGQRGVRFLSYLAAILISYSFLMVFWAIHLSPNEWWQKVSNPAIPDMQMAFKSIFGQGLWIVVGSLTAFLVGQVIDVFIFHTIKKSTGERHIWLRATGSTLVSQLIDSFIVLFIAFYIGADWSFGRVMAIGVVNYIYKFSMAILLTPLVYLVHEAVERYLGSELAEEMKKNAAK